MSDLKISPPQRLAPCPFCASDGSTLLRGFVFPKGSSEREDAVRCPTCDAQAPAASWAKRCLAAGSAPACRDPHWEVTGSSLYLDGVNVFTVKLTVEQEGLLAQLVADANRVSSSPPPSLGAGESHEAKRMRKLARDIRQADMERLAELTWIDKDRIINALERAAAIGDNILCAPFSSPPLPQSGGDIDQIANDAAREIDGLSWNNATHRIAKFHIVIAKAIRAAFSQGRDTEALAAGVSINMSSRGPDCACCERQPHKDCTVPGCTMKDADWALPSAPQTGIGPRLQCLRCGTVDAFGPVSEGK